MTEAEIADPQASSGLCDDEGVPLICPTCQVLAQSVLAGDRLLTLHGVVFDIFVGSHSDAARLRESGLKPHTRARPSMKMGTIASPWRYDFRRRSAQLLAGQRRRRTGRCALVVLQARSKRAMT